MEQQEEIRGRIPLVGIRRTIAERMVASLHASAQLTVSLEVDATELVLFRESIIDGFEMASGIRPTYTDLLIALTTQALQQHPLLNSTLEGNEVVLHRDVNIGIAVALENGLVVPVLRQAQHCSLREIAHARFDLARRATEGKLTLEDVQGGTFTISNAAGAGADITTPILNPPQNAILGVGRIAKKPAVYQDEIRIRHLVWLSVTFDHRAMDGVPAARFLDSLDTLLQEPSAHLKV